MRARAKRALPAPSIVAFSRLSTSVTAAFSGGNLNRSLISHGLLICRRPPQAALRWLATVCLHSFSRAVANGAGRPLTKTGPIAISFVTTMHLLNFGSTAAMIRPDESNRASDPRVSSRFRLSRPPGVSQFASRSLRPLSAGCQRLYPRPNQRRPGLSIGGSGGCGCRGGGRSPYENDSDANR